MTNLYRHFAADNRLLYVGISLSSISRLIQHRDNSAWFNDISRVEIQKFSDRAEALEAERIAIEDEKPIYNKHRARPHTRRETRVTELAKESREDLTRRMVAFNVAYTVDEVARLLDIGKAAANRLIAEKRIGFIRVPSLREGQRDRVRITGWQLIDYLETASQA